MSLAVFAALARSPREPAMASNGRVAWPAVRRYSLARRPIHSARLAAIGGPWLRQRVIGMPSLACRRNIAEPRNSRWPARRCCAACSDQDPDRLPRSTSPCFSGTLACAARSSPLRSVVGADEAIAGETSAPAASLSTGTKVAADSTPDKSTCCNRQPAKPNLLGAASAVNSRRTTRRRFTRMPLAPGRHRPIRPRSVPPSAPA